MAKDPIRRIELKDGTVRYRFVVDIGRDPVTGKRQQKTHTFDKKKDATKELDRIRHQTNEGTYVKPSKETVSEYIDSYLKGATRGKEESTKSNYVAAFRCVRERLGHIQLQRISKGDIEDLVDFMLTKGRKRGGKAGTPLSARSVQLTLGRLTAALEMAVLEGKLVRNVAKLVKPPSIDQEEREPWSQEEVHAFLSLVQTHRLHAAWRLSLYGLRRAEVLGLRWEDIDLSAKTLAVVQTRVLVDWRVIVVLGQPHDPQPGFGAAPDVPAALVPAGVDVPSGRRSAVELLDSVMIHGRPSSYRSRPSSAWWTTSHRTDPSSCFTGSSRGPHGQFPTVTCSIRSSTGTT